MGRILLVLTLALTASACSYFFGKEGHFRDRSMDYQKAESIEAISIPDDMQTTKFEELLPIPQINTEHENPFVPTEFSDVPQPLALLSVEQGGGLQLKADDDRRWVVTQSSLSELWPKVIAFLDANKISIVRKNIAEGEIETDWLKPSKHKQKNDGFVNWAVGWMKSKERLREKFLFQFRPGDKAGTTNVYVIHKRVKAASAKGEEGLPEPHAIKWPTVSDDPQLELGMVTELIDFLASDEANTKTSALLAHNLTDQPRYNMTKDGNGYPVLNMELDFNRAWAAIGESLAKAKIPVDDLNRTLAVYYIKYPGEEEGEFDIYEVKLNQGETGIQVAIQVDDETLAPIDRSSLLLTLIKENLG